ncbi:TetR/AcrR family transcriptional regulator [Rhodococcus sp. NPDC057529]|uniref:TetR/AcrR family transcriptional regulator n=1 Tax=Rhodococcus sp. NPDC057529 TaxID=3346158 RepID=UPI00366DAA15
MPKIVDRQARRTEIARAYLQMVAQHGVEGVTTRSLAQELGIAAGALWNYFDDTRALTIAAFELYFADITSRIDEIARGVRGVAAMRVLLREVLPLSAVGQQEARVSLSFYGQVAIADPLHEVQRRAEARWRDMLVSHIREAVEDGALRADIAPEDLADLLVALAVGLQIEYVTGSPNGQPRRQEELLGLALRPWLVDHPALAEFEHSDR